jgi:hypothetical protein
MQVDLYYKYSTIDKQHEFSISCEDESFLAWIFYHLGALSAKEKKWWRYIYPYRLNYHRHVKTYKIGNAETVARLIYNRIEKQITK